MTDARTLTLTLGGKWHRRYGVAPCPVCQPEQRRDQDALTLTDKGGKLLLHCKKSGCAYTGILGALGLCPHPLFTQNHNDAARGKNEAEKRAWQAKRLWAEAVPIRGTLAETYLHGRGITCALPETLRFQSDCWHPNAKRFPALVALVEGGEGFAVHRTYLRADGLGKAAAEPAKAMLGAVRGGAVRVCHAAGPLVVAEGIETALSLASGLLHGPATIWAALSTSGMESLRLPFLAGRLTIATDGDEPGRKAGEALAVRATAAGWRVSLLPAPLGRDWNDVLALKGGAA